MLVSVLMGVAGNAAALLFGHAHPTVHVYVPKCVSKLQFDWLG